MKTTLKVIVVAGTFANLLLALDRLSQETTAKQGFQAGFAALGFIVALKRFTTPEDPEAV
jgi:hypothetical protein